jgi:RNA polymerase sigma-70 factor (ECF subfamily)
LWKLQSAAAFRVWVYRIAHDQAVSELRRKARRPVMFEDIPTGRPPEPTGDDDTAFEDAELVHAALVGLSIDHRRVLTLRFLEDMSIEEIAQVVGCGVGTVKSRLHYAKAALRHQNEELRDE